MRLCRFNDNRLGLVVEDHVFDVSDILDTLPQYRYPLPRFDPFIAQLDELTTQIHAKARNAKALPLSNIQILSPVASPGKIIAAPVNYQKHLVEARADPGIHHANQIAEIQKVGLFLKATSSLVGPSHGVVIRHSERRNDHEIELAVVIGKRAEWASEVKALDVVAGYCIGLDMTMRGSEERSLRKSLDTFTVLGPWMVTADEFAEHLPAISACRRRRHRAGTASDGCRDKTRPQQDWRFGRVPHASTGLRSLQRTSPLQQCAA
jgi:2,4-didehydro-3-deoxy-L-rhamnonate hydrolase